MIYGSGGGGYSGSGGYGGGGKGYMVKVVEDTVEVVEALKVPWGLSACWGFVFYCLSWHILGTQLDVEASAPESQLTSWYLHS